MDKIFKASNGLEFRDAVHRLEWRRSWTHSDWNAVGAALEDMPAGFAVDSAIGEGLAEFYQHQRDQQLGRWRWPENPDYVVYRRGEDRARVIHEPSGDFSDSVRGTMLPGPFRDAARAFFDAHPAEPKPWDAAEEGDVWVLTGAGGMELPWRRTAEGTWESITPKTIRRRNEDCITAGRRIWPEGG